MRAQEGGTCKQDVCPARAAFHPPLGEDSDQSWEVEELPGDHTRPHSFFLAFGNCDGALNVAFDVVMLNKKYGAWGEQFSCEESGLLELHVSFCVLFLLLCGFHTRSFYALRKAQAVNVVISMFTWALFLQLIGLLCGVIHYAVFASDGFGVPGLRDWGRHMDMFSQAAYISVIIACGYGWNVSQRGMERRAKLALSILVSCYVALYTAMVLVAFEALNESPSQSFQSMWSTPFGVAITVLRALSAIWFLWAVIRSYRSENLTDKKTFYRITAVSFGGWLMALPFVLFLSAFLVPYTRIWFITFCLMLATFVSMFITVCLMLPSRAGRYFDVALPELLGRDDSL
eukprot:TRINITY_DN1864_c0_g1_i2.p1 TRINITY_DN1864_c0_g1~~TRINITY_DN1864_c0_g1_i2.p1  ORF type:complete len:344 (-),score=64.90 TRINITY_DN1864_c0_g1_i2:28-1059(-)